MKINLILPINVYICSVYMINTFVKLFFLEVFIYLKKTILC